ncbi:unnamed protein product [Trifolium pratense]|uniref:Uncharacterized protein n=1 Tax=Trifolium pratense TaxID=57577 RepID=A0ACB0IE25_TRIPR|nr:unnamed protein product [Trifolium pratense]
MCQVITEDISLTGYSSHGLTVIIYGKKNFKPGKAEGLGLVGGGSTQQLVGTPAMASLRHQLQFSADSRSISRLSSQIVQHIPQNVVEAPNVTHIILFVHERNFRTRLHCGKEATIRILHLAYFVPNHGFFCCGAP